MDGIIEIENFFSAEDCSTFLDQMHKFLDRESFIIHDAQMAEFWRRKVLSSVPNIMRCMDGWYEVKDIASNITIGNQDKPIRRHIDTQFSQDNFAKIAVYLNDSVGTYFRVEDMDYYASGGKGKAVMFDIRYEHWGADLPMGGRKLVGGFRVIGRKINEGGQVLKKINK